MRLVRVPLRISLVGGGTDFPAHYEKYGGGVVSFTINKYIYITAKPNVSLFPHKFRLVYSKVEECALPQEIKHPIIRSVVDDYNLESLDLDVMSDVPAGTGLGSSSAFTVGLHMALGDSRDKYQLASLACTTEIEDLKEPIGIQDQFATAFGGLNYLQFRKGRISVQPLLLPGEEIETFQAQFLLLYLGGQRSASTVLSRQDSSDKHVLKEMGAIAGEFSVELSRGELSSMGHMVAENWLLKKQLNPAVSNDRVDAVLATASNAGATGGKLLGAGGTGFILLVCPPENQGNVLKSLSSYNLTHVPFKIDFEGAKVLYED